MRQHAEHGIGKGLARYCLFDYICRGNRQAYALDAVTAGSAPASISERLAAPPALAYDHEVSLTFINVELGRSVFDLTSEAPPCAVPCRNWLCGAVRAFAQHCCAALRHRLFEELYGGHGRQAGWYVG